MAIASTAVFNLDADEVIESAFARVGGEQVTGFLLRMARRELQLMLQQWCNLGVNMWCTERQYITLIDGVNKYYLPQDVVDIQNMESRQQNAVSRLTTTGTNIISTTSGSAVITVADPDNGASTGDQVVITTTSAVGGLALTAGVTYTLQTAAENSYTASSTSAATSTQALGGGATTLEYLGYTDLPVTRMSLDDWARFTNKTNPGGPPRLFYLDRQINPVVYIYPLPNGQPPTQLVYWYQRRLKDVPTLGSNIDIPNRFLPAIVSGLAYRLSLLRPQIPLPLRQDLKAIYDDEFSVARDEDRDASPLRIEPNFSAYYRP